MQAGGNFDVYIGFDSREPVCSYVAAHSIYKRTRAKIDTHYLKHRELSKNGLFNRPWIISGENRETIDLIDGKTFST